MKIIVGTKNLISVQAETIKESVLLYTFVNQGKENEPAKVTTTKKEKKRKKYVLSKVCDICGQVCKGQAGLSIHTVKAHPKKVATGLLDEVVKPEEVKF